MRAVLQTTTAELATKTDLREMKTEIDGRLTLLQWMIGLSLALSVGIISMLSRNNI